MNSINIFQQISAGRLTIKQCPNFLTKSKSTYMKKEDLKEKIKMKTPIGNVK